VNPLNITVRVAEDPTRVDPENVAADIEAIYNEWASANSYPPIHVEEAHWLGDVGDEVGNDG